MSVMKAKTNIITSISVSPIQGQIQDFKLGGVHLRKLCRAEGGTKIFGVFRVKNYDFTPKKNPIFSNFRGAHAIHPPWICPCYWIAG